SGMELETCYASTVWPDGSHVFVLLLYFMLQICGVLFSIYPPKLYSLYELIIAKKDIEADEQTGSPRHGNVKSRPAKREGARSQPRYSLSSSSSPLPPPSPPSSSSSYHIISYHIISQFVTSSFF